MPRDVPQGRPARARQPSPVVLAEEIALDHRSAVSGRQPPRILADSGYIAEEIVARVVSAIDPEA